ncbi:MAG: S8/S53 family peptidase [Myxococcales bacterium]|nr:S8/S53 family peptidase [Myxococcales bacterium]MCB9647530.1 S8/S53 family peptidase [Deltaproteobacteria bacterium]
MAIPFSDPKFDTFTVQTNVGSVEELTRHLDTDLAARPVPGLDGYFDVTSFRKETLTPADAFALAREMVEKLPGVLHAEPCFELDSTNTPEAGEDAHFDLAALLWERGPGVPDPLWATKFIELEEVPAIYTGQGVRIAHPDSGFVRHGELQRSFVDLASARDFVDGDLDPDGPYRHVSHGVSTASVIVSDSRTSPADHVRGVAPGATLVPLRVTKKHGLVPAPVLFRAGARRLRDAILHAVETECDVISISLGWLWNSGLRAAIGKALSKGMIVLAAAGNYIRTVVWPARYEEVIAIAGCNVCGNSWSGSCRGDDVDLAGPAQDVWRAYFDGSTEAVGPSSGTSYAVAMTAGVAALWLQKHGGRAKLVHDFGGPAVQELFRATIRKHCGSRVADQASGFGEGTLNAKKVMDAALPTLRRPVQPAAFAPTSEALLDDLLRAGPKSFAAESGRTLLDSFRGFEDELAFNLLTQPSLRTSRWQEDVELAVNRHAKALFDRFGGLERQPGPPSLWAALRALPEGTLSPMLKEKVERVAP